MLSLLASLGVADRKVLLLTDGVKPNVFLSSRNIPTTHVLPYADASTYHILWSDVVVIESSALGESTDVAAEAEAAPAKKPRAKKAAPAASEE
jgi:large subunit ribosomal protein L4